MWKKKDFAFLKPELYNTSDCQDVAMWSLNVFFTTWQILTYLQYGFPEALTMSMSNSISY